MQNYKVMSFNVRIQTEDDHEQQFNRRVDFLCDFLRETAPDVCGFQELHHTMRLEVLRRLPGYGILGGGREKDGRGEGAAILYKEDRLMPERLETRMLSYAPHIPGSSFGGDQSSCPRCFSSVDFVPFTEGQPFRFMNVHLDHVGKNARKLEIAQLLRFYEEQQAIRGLPTLLTGDFNMTPETEEMTLIENHGAFRDLAANAGGTFHNYGRLEKAEHIDYIFADSGVKAVNAYAAHEMRGGLYLSDHDPVIAEIEL